MYDDEKKIVRATVGQMPAELLVDPQPKVTATFEDGEVKDLFYFEPTEINFTEAEFIGLTEKGAHDLFHKKDIEYLQTPDDPCTDETMSL